ncbi:unnamed protein product [Diatraea saccharalis]|uniref:Gamma-glutamyltransferase n=1 Tax=Diatraea saccharalis TaxID=40085 RepID=A0A9N9W9Z9_9NEOP|nr:unnamed protein product [Diatraea saccharalis]
MFWRNSTSGLKQINFNDQFSPEMTNDTADSPEHQAPGVVELREDVPLKAGVEGSGGVWGGGSCVRGPKLIVAAFAALSAAITLALLTQIYYGDYEIVPHGATSSSVAACSRAGTDALKDGGFALDAAVAAALCLAVTAPHRTSMDASGSMLYWEYRQSRTQQPSLIEWGGSATQSDAHRPPRLVAALAALHAQLGVLPWSRLVQPAIELAREGFPVSEGLAAVEGAAGMKVMVPGAMRSAPALADFLETLKKNTSAELSAAWNSASLLRKNLPRATTRSGVRVWAGGPGAGVALEAIETALQTTLSDPDQITLKVVNSLQQAAAAEGSDWPPAGVASGLAVIDRRDNYLALVTGLSMPFGNGALTGEGWAYDEPTAPLDLAPAFLTDDLVCGTRYVIGAESSAALAQAAVILATGGGAGGVEHGRLQIVRGGALGLEATRPEPLFGSPAPTINASLPYAAVNVVQQRGDSLLSHADSRGGGLASRF